MPDGILFGCIAVVQFSLVLGYCPALQEWLLGGRRVNRRRGIFRRLQ